MGLSPGEAIIGLVIAALTVALFVGALVMLWGVGRDVVDEVAED